MKRLLAAFLFGLSAFAAGNADAQVPSATTLRTGTLRGPSVSAACLFFRGNASICDQFGTINNSTGRFTLDPASLPLPSLSTLGGIQAVTCPSTNFVNGIGTNGQVTCAVPAGGGGGGSPGGSSGQLQVNSSGAFAGVTPGGDLSFNSGTGAFTLNNGAVTSGKLAAGVAVANLGYQPLNPASNLSDLGSVTSARSNLGLGAMAVLGAAASGDLSGTWPSLTIGSGAVTGAKMASGAAITNLGFTPVNKAGDTITGSITFQPNAGYGNVTITPMNNTGSFGDNASQLGCNNTVSSSTVGGTSPVFTCLQVNTTIATGTNAFAWPIMGTAAVTSTIALPNPSLGAQHVGITGRFIRYNFAAGGAANNPTGWGGLSANFDLTGMPSSLSNWGLIHEFDGTADGPDAGKIRGGAVVALTRRGVAVQAVTGTSANASNIVTSVGTNLTTGATISGYSGTSVVGWTIEGPGVPANTVVTAVGATAITMSANAAAGFGSGTFNVRPTAEFANAFSCATGDPAGGTSAAAVNVGNCWTTNAQVREAVYDARGANLIGTAKALWLGDNKPIGWDTAGAVQTKYNPSTTRIEWSVGGGVVAWLDTTGNLLVNGNLSGSFGSSISWTPTVTCATGGGTVTATTTTTARKVTIGGQSTVFWTARVRPTAQSGTCTFLQITPPSTPSASLGFTQTAYDETVGALMMSTITAGDAHIIFRGVGNSGTITTNDFYSSNGWYLE